MNRITTRKWLEIVRFELVFQLRRRSTQFFFGLFLIPLIGVTREQWLDVNREIVFHAPLLRAENSVLMSVVALLVLAAVAADAATRDVHTRLEPLMHAAPVGRAAYVGGRFFGAFAVAAILLSAVPLVHIAVPLFLSGEAKLAGPFRLAAHVQSYCLLILPNAFVVTAMMFALAMLVRHTAGSYAGAALLLAGMQFGVGFIAEGLGLWDLARVLDPTGLTALEHMSRTWSPVELNERLIGSDGALLLNRLLWILIACAALVLTTWRFDFGGSAGAVRWWHYGRRRATRAVPSASVGRSVPVAAPRAPRAFGFAARVRQTLSITRDSLREVMTGWTWLVLPFVALKIVLTLDMLGGMGAGTMVLPTTGRVLEPLEDDAPPLVLAIVMFPVFIAGELIWRERDANMQELSDAAPVPDGVRFVGKLLGLWLVFVALHAILMFAGLVTQVLRGWYDFDLAVYFQILGLRLVDALVFALFAMSVHVLVNQKHVAHLLALLLIVAPRLLAQLFGIEHPLLILGHEPSWRHSPISGFEPFLGPVLWFELYWAAWTVFLALVVRLLWVRGVERGLLERVRIARRDLTGRRVVSVAAALAVVLLVGGFVFYNTNVLNTYRSSAESIQRMVEYEQRYGRFRDAPQPRLAATELDIELHPDRREADVRGVHHLVNRTAQPIDTIHVAISSEVETADIELGRPARAEVLDDELRHHTYVLDEPLQPGDSLRMSWRVRHAPRGFPAGGVSPDVVGNGSFIVMASWMPLIGYQPSRELANAGERSEHALPPRASVPLLDDVDARSDPYGMDRVDLEINVGTAADQIAVAPGELQETWEQGGRRYFRYATDAPVGNEYAIFSARYAVCEARWRDVALEVVHHPEHDLNVERMIRGMQASLEQFTARFGPYPYEVLRFVEYPAAGGSLHATAATVWYKELFSLFDPDHEPRRIDLPFAVVAHEVAHQFQPVAASVEGRSLLSESFAWYAALGVIEQEYGAEHLQRFLGFMREAYRDPRSRADVPLLRASDFFLGYRKGPFAMYALQEYVGRESVDLAWRRLRERHASGEPPFATSLDLVRELQQVTPDFLQYLVADLIERNTFWELRTNEASVLQTQSGEWQVTLEVAARKVVVDTVGTETEMPMDDLIEIGVYAPAENDESQGTPLDLAMHRIRTGAQTITVAVPAEPARAGIDPRHLLIDVEPADNVMTIGEASSSNE